MPNDWLDYDHFLYNNHPQCPRCKKEMHIAVLSGSSDPYGHTNEYFCEWCPKEMNIRVIIKVRDPVAMEAKRKYEKFEKEHPIICQQHFSYAVQNMITRMDGKLHHNTALPVRANF